MPDSSGTHAKDSENQAKHGVSFGVSQRAFLDPQRVIAEDARHGGGEKRFFCIGMVGGGVLTVRFTVRGDAIRIFGAGYWRRGKQIYGRRIRYTDEPMGEPLVVKDFLPPPSRLALKEDTVKVTIALSRASVSFFKRQARVAWYVLSEDDPAAD